MVSERPTSLALTDCAGTGAKGEELTDRSSRRLNQYISWQDTLKVRLD